MAQPVATATHPGVVRLQHQGASTDNVYEPSANSLVTPTPAEP